MGVKRFAAIFALVALPLAAAEPQTETVSGTVLYSQPWQFFLLKTEDRVVRVQTKQGAPELSPGATDASQSKRRDTRRKARTASSRRRNPSDRKTFRASSTRGRLPTSTECPYA